MRRQPPRCMGGCVVAVSWLHDPQVVGVRVEA
jgi:hypothetical protein